MSPDRQSLEPAAAIDAADPLAGFRDEFVHADDEPDLIYLDGNSLGRQSLRSAAAVVEALEVQWGRRLIRGWNDGWFELPR